MRSGVTGSDASSPVDRAPSVEHVAPAGPVASVQPENPMRVRCCCGAWHSGEHVVDGIEVTSMHCRFHAHDSFRGLWATDDVSYDPRAKQRRFKPHNIRKCAIDFIVAAIKKRTDLLDPPGSIEPIRTGDARVDYVPLKDVMV